MENKNYDEFGYRRLAIRLTIRGKRACEILKRIPRSRQWLYKWQRRFEQYGWAGLANQSRQPDSSPQEYQQAARKVIINVRRKFMRNNVGLIGAQAIRAEIIKRRLLQATPCEATIKEWLKAAGLIEKPAVAREKVYYPAPYWHEGCMLQAMDWTARYITGGEKVFAFHTIDAQTRALQQTIKADKTVTSVIEHVLEVWQNLGLPTFLQLDNDSAFNGGGKTCRRFGHFVRLALYFGIELIFTPPAEPKRNWLVESLNGLWAKSFWDRNKFRALGDVRRKSVKFIGWYRDTYLPPALNGLTPAQAQRTVKSLRLTKRQILNLPAQLPITEGR